MNNDETLPQPDADAMDRLRVGDDLALNEIMSRWQEPLVRFIYRYTQNEGDALDLAQETFVRVYQHRGKYDRRAKFSTWLYTIATNLCRNQARWKLRHPNISMEMKGSADSSSTLGEKLPGRERTPVKNAEMTELATAIASAFQALPTDQRTAALLHEYDDLPTAEIAAILGCSSKAAESKLYRARQFLRETLAVWV